MFVLSFHLESPNNFSFIKKKPHKHFLGPPAFWSRRLLHWRQSGPDFFCTYTSLAWTSFAPPAAWITHSINLPDVAVLKFSCASSLQVSLGPEKGFKLQLWVSFFFKTFLYRSQKMLYCQSRFRCNYLIQVSSATSKAWAARYEGCVIYSFIS